MACSRVLALLQALALGSGAFAASCGDNAAFKYSECVVTGMNEEACNAIRNSTAWGAYQYTGRNDCRWCPMTHANGGKTVTVNVCMTIAAGNCTLDTPAYGDADLRAGECPDSDHMVIAGTIAMSISWLISAISLFMFAVTLS